MSSTTQTRTWELQSLVGRAASSETLYGSTSTPTRLKGPLLSDMIADDFDVFGSDDERDEEAGAQAGFVASTGFGSSMSPRAAELDAERPVEKLWSQDLRKDRRKQARGLWTLLLVIAVIMGTLSFAMKLTIERIQDCRYSLMMWLDPDFGWTAVAVWVVFTVVVVHMSIWWTRYWCPLALGGGIPEMRTIIAGDHLEGVLSLRTLVAKAGGMALALGGGVWLGSEGPYAHMASIIAHHVDRQLFKGMTTRRGERWILSAACALGVTTDFECPLGGTMFSVETTSSYYAVRDYWKTLLCAGCGTMTMYFWDLVPGLDVVEAVEVETNVPWKSFQYYEIPLFALVGVITGIMGVIFVKTYQKLTAWKRKFGLHNALWFSYIVLPTLICLITGFVTAPGVVSPLLPVGPGRIHTFWQADKASMLTKFEGIDSRADVVTHLLIYAGVGFVLELLSLQLPVPCGVYFPLIAIGAATGRAVGELLLWLPQFDVDPRLYAAVGAAGFSVSVTHTISTIIIITELLRAAPALGATAVHETLPLIVAGVVAYILVNRYSLSIYQSMARIRSLSYLPEMKDFTNLPFTVEDIMMPTRLVLSDVC
eukprot:NODE_65_length_2923_cov_61.854793_g61_i0.p1 GENE.NODE_65_length_2923_cov_61.854793_g61_i0~~NODE_65_length_2923_cov_61.854793_g61_i0.p1  ORF type:complete len:595 (-),score=67.69 NODE_65_length_2923_cov_61.854793_g61_i0:1044-2828(-)